MIKGPVVERFQRILTQLNAIETKMDCLEQDVARVMDQYARVGTTLTMTELNLQAMKNSAQDFQNEIRNSRLPAPKIYWLSLIPIVVVAWIFATPWFATVITLWAVSQIFRTLWK